MDLDSLFENDDGFLKFEKLRVNFDWFYSNYDELRKNYKSQYVAVKEKTNIDNDYDLERLLKRLNLYNCDESIAIEYVAG
jgi:hypothetical protein